MHRLYLLHLNTKGRDRQCPRNDQSTLWHRIHPNAPLSDSRAHNGIWPVPGTHSMDFLGIAYETQDYKTMAIERSAVTLDLMDHGVRQ